MALPDGQDDGISVVFVDGDPRRRRIGIDTLRQLSERSLIPRKLDRVLRWPDEHDPRAAKELNGSGALSEGAISRVERCPAQHLFGIVAEALSVNPLHLRGDLCRVAIGLAEAPLQPHPKSTGLLRQSNLQCIGVVGLAEHHHRSCAERHHLAHSANAHLALIRDDHMAHFAAGHGGCGKRPQVVRREIDQIGSMTLTGSQTRRVVPQARSPCVRGSSVAVEADEHVEVVRVWLRCSLESGGEIAKGCTELSRAWRLANTTLARSNELAKR